MTATPAPSAPSASPLGSPGTGVLVTGGGSGIGRATAVALAEVGRPVAMWDIDGAGAEETTARCRALGVVAHAAVVDVADSDGIAEAVAAAAVLGSLGGFVHATGVPGAAEIDDLDDTVWDATLNVNLRAAVVICRHLLDSFRQAGPGSSVVLISSIEGFFGSSVLIAYCASKGGVLGVMRSLAQRFATEGFRVNAV